MATMELQRSPELPILIAISPMSQSFDCSLSRIKWNRIAFAIIFVLSRHARDSIIERVPSPLLRALTEHIWRHCSYSNARQDP